MNDFWDTRYSSPDYIYGKEPNEYLRSKGGLFRPGMKVLCLGDGEGRNGSWVAKTGAEVTSIDLSNFGLEKARKLAQSQGVRLHAIQGDFLQWPFQSESFDAVVNIFVHFSPVERKAVHKRASEIVKAGGFYLTEVFHRDQLGFKSGGPQDPEMLSTAEILKADFSDFEILEARDCRIELDEGPFHQGPGAVVRFLARKK